MVDTATNTETGTRTLVGRPTIFIGENAQSVSSDRSGDYTRTHSNDMASGGNIDDADRSIAGSSRSPSPGPATVSTASGSNATAPNIERRVRLVPVRTYTHSHAGPITGAESRPVERKIAASVYQASQDPIIIRIGRSDQLGRGGTDGPMPIMYKSKVVSRKHAEIVLQNGQWLVRDTGSSSGTFLNGRRLSEQGSPSELKVLHHGDDLQLGVNYRGGSNGPQFRCVRLRVELDEDAGIRPSGYNIESFQRLRESFRGASSAASTSSEPQLQDCCVCLQPLRPGEPLFISPCAHGWHYRCIRPLLVESYPLFGCPNCRRTFDVEEDVYNDDDCGHDHERQHVPA